MSNHKKLSLDWVTDSWIDFEYKKYKLLAYLEYITQHFDKRELYPMFTDLITHYHYLVELRDSKKLINSRFPQKLKTADLENIKLRYQKILEDDEIMKEIENIINFALPQMRNTIAVGKEIYDWIEQGLEVVPIGITPIYFKEGYLFLYPSWQNSFQIYYYQLKLFNHIEHSKEVWRGIMLKLLDEVQKSRFDTFEKIKTTYTKKNKSLPNPATFLIEGQVLCSLEASLLPIAKRKLISYLTHLETS